MQKAMVCIACPLGCRLTVSDEGGVISVSGHTCPRGEKYGIAETTNPTRMVTSSVPVTGGHMSMASVRTAAPIPKSKIPDALDAIRAFTAAAPVSVGQVLIKDVAGTGVDIIATRNVNVGVAV